MKIKIDFVTNSSSASFSIPMDKITEQQKIMIYNHLDFAKMLFQVKIYEYAYRNSGWDIWEKDGDICGYTSMDNFDMHGFLVDVIKIPKEHIDYEVNH